MRGYVNHYFRVFPNKKTGLKSPAKKEYERKYKNMKFYSHSGSPVAIDVKMDMTPYVAEIPMMVNQSISIIFTASVPINVTKD